MIHPHTRLQFINDEIGYGVFATEFIPKGTITYVKDPLELEIKPEDFITHSTAMQQIIEKYSYIDQRGVRIVSWDCTKNVNHCCNCNTMSTGYGFEIAIRDIQAKEEITDEYGMLNIEKPLKVKCVLPECRGEVCKSDFELNFHKWDEQLMPVIKQLFDVEQPLLPFMDELTLHEVQSFIIDPQQYKSVYSLKFHGTKLNGVEKKMLPFMHIN